MVPETSSSKMVSTWPGFLLSHTNQYVACFPPCAEASPVSAIVSKNCIDKIYIIF
jgi:hypothetical protein